MPKEITDRELLAILKKKNPNMLKELKADALAKRNSEKERIKDRKALEQKRIGSQKATSESDKRLQKEFLRRNLYVKVEKLKVNKKKPQKYVVVRDLKTNKKLYSEKGKDIKQINKYDINATINTFQITKKKRFDPKKSNKDNLSGFEDRTFRGKRVMTAKLDTPYISRDPQNKQKTFYISSKGYSTAEGKKRAINDIERKLSQYQLEKSNIKDIEITNIKTR